MHRFGGPIGTNFGGLGEPKRRQERSKMEAKRRQERHMITGRKQEHHKESCGGFPAECAGPLGTKLEEIGPIPLGTPCTPFGGRRIQVKAPWGGNTASPFFVLSLSRPRRPTILIDFCRFLIILGRIWGSQRAQNAQKATPEHAQFLRPKKGPK